jgi:hypothetical protein
MTVVSNGRGVQAGDAAFSVLSETRRIGVIQLYDVDAVHPSIAPNAAAHAWTP